jgi:hypothetical protein
MIPHERSLVERLAKEPFALIGVNSDDDRDALKARSKKEGVTWRSFWDGPGGKIAKAWNVRGWPTIYIIDHTGVLRYRDVREEKELDRVIDELVAEAKAAAR